MSTKIMLLGDTHGDTSHVVKMCRIAKRQNVDLMIQLGDWGFCWGVDNRLQNLHNVLEQFDMKMWWLDGNHEDFDQLKGMGVHTDADNFVPMTDRITYLPRGFRFEIDGVTFMALGGAYSIDQAYRIPGSSWWPDETITMRDVARACDGDLVDVLLAHDCPELPPNMRRWMTPLGYKIDKESQANRLNVTLVAQSVEPRAIFHGHYHRRYNDIWEGTLVVGLGMNGAGDDSYVITTTDNIMWEIEELKAKVAKIEGIQ